MKDTGIYLGVSSGTILTRISVGEMHFDWQGFFLSFFYLFVIIVFGFIGMAIQDSERFKNTTNNITQWIGKKKQSETPT